MTHVAPCGHQELADAIVGFVARKSGVDVPRLRDLVESTIADAGDNAVAGLQARLAKSADAWAYYGRDPLAHRLHHELARVVLKDAPVVIGAGRLDALRHGPAIIVANHLSYSDANVIEVLLHQCGYPDIANRLAVIAGPKVYSDLGRRFSSLCFGTIRSPQNEQVSSGEAAMSARDVACAAKQTLAAARARLNDGDVLLLFPEGTRSRSGRIQSFLPGVARYFENDADLILPIGLCGTEQMFGIGEDRLGAATISMTVGEPFTAGAVRARSGDDRRRFVDLLAAAVAAQLPPQYRDANPGRETELL